MGAENRIHDIQLNLRAPNDFVAVLDDWRSTKRPILTRSEAIRVLVLKALEHEQKLTKPPTAPPMQPPEHVKFPTSTQVS